MIALASRSLKQNILLATKYGFAARSVECKFTNQTGHKIKCGRGYIYHGVSERDQLGEGIQLDVGQTLTVNYESDGFMTGCAASKRFQLNGHKLFWAVSIPYAGSSTTGFSRESLERAYQNCKNDSANRKWKQHYAMSDVTQGDNVHCKVVFK